MLYGDTLVPVRPDFLHQNPGGSAQRTRLCDICNPQQAVAHCSRYSMLLKNVIVLVIDCDASTMNQEPISDTYSCA